MAQRKKIGILTFHRAHNYGAVWQCYALKQACESLGHEVETIDYNPFGSYTILGSLHHRPYVALRYIINMVRFSRFVSKRLNLTIKRYIDQRQLKQDAPKDNVYIVGSDTVWSNPTVKSYLDSY